MTREKTARGILMLLMMAVVLSFGAGMVFAADPVSKDNAPEALSLTDVQTGLQYQAHVSQQGWQNPIPLAKQDQGDVFAGTSGKGLAIEALRIQQDSNKLNPAQLGIQYEAHVAQRGWLAPVSSADTNGMAGTVGQKLAVQAVRMKLTGTEASRFHLYYRVHVQNYGWLDWACDGENAGTTGFDLRVEAIQIKMLAADSHFVGSTVRPYVDASKLNNGSVRYAAHVQQAGWQNAVQDGATAGTEGRSLRLEAVRMNAQAANLPPGIKITYRGHVQNSGWQAWKSDGQTAGTVGRGLRLEALQAKLTGPMAARYNLYYRAHVAYYGWLDWTAGGQTAGTTGLAYPMEAIQVTLREKSQGAPGATAMPSVGAAQVAAGTQVNYRAHVSGIGWQSRIANGRMAGTTGQKRAVEAIDLNLSGLVRASSVHYRMHVQKIGWQGWKSDGQMAGTTGCSLRGEALQIKLSGTAAALFDVYYRVHAQNVGWLGWAKNGQEAGTSSGGLRMEAFEVRLVRKGSRAPGSTARPYVKMVPKSSKAFGWMPVSPTCICVDRPHQTLKAYVNGREILSTPVITGRPGMSTPAGNYKIRAKQSPSVLIGPGYRSYVRYWMPFIRNSIGIHDASWQDAKGYGGNAYLIGRGSHGCVNTPLWAVKKIYTTFPVGTPVCVR